MKRLIAILIFFTCMSLTTEAQVAMRQTTSNPTGAITNTSIDTMSYTLSQSYGTVSIQPVVTKATGTMAICDRTLVVGHVAVRRQREGAAFDGHGARLDVSGRE